MMKCMQCTKLPAWGVLTTTWFLKTPITVAVTPAGISFQSHLRRELLPKKTGHHCWGRSGKSGRLYNCCLWLLHNQHVHTNLTSWARAHSQRCTTSQTSRTHLQDERRDVSRTNVQTQLRVFLCTPCRFRDFYALIRLFGKLFSYFSDCSEASQRLKSKSNTMYGWRGDRRESKHKTTDKLINSKLTW